MKCPWWTRNFVFGAVAVLLFLLILFIPFGTMPVRAQSMLALVVFMAILWASACIPIYVTSLLPLIFLPLLGIMPANDAASSYWNDAICLFLSSFFFTETMIETSLHKRIALRCLVLCGPRPRLFLMFVCLITAVFSMFISNTATCALMVPLVQLVLEETEGDTLSDVEMEPLAAQETAIAKDQKLSNKFGKAALLCVAYSASIGGTATLVGTGPNLVLSAQLQLLFPRFSSISFLQWMAFAAPMALVLVIIVWAFSAFFVARGYAVDFRSETTRTQLLELGPVKFEEILLLILLLICGLLWLTRRGFGAGGWGVYFPFVGDGTVSAFCSTILFVIPRPSDPTKKILPHSVLRTLNWEVILLLGGGFSLAAGFQASGLNAVMSATFAKLSGVPVALVVIISVAFATFATEVSSNVATANILIPTSAALAISMNQNPLLLMVPVTLACSMAFALPIATPPNAIAFSSGYLTTGDMLKVGLLLNVIAIAICSGWIFILGKPIFGILVDDFPSWAAV